MISWKRFSLPTLPFSRFELLGPLEEGGGGDWRCSKRSSHVYKATTHESINLLWKIQMFLSFQRFHIMEAAVEKLFVCSSLAMHSNLDRNWPKLKVALIWLIGQDIYPNLLRNGAI
jgi:hypothetical protein